MTDVTWSTTRCHINRWRHWRTRIDVWVSLPRGIEALHRREWVIGDRRPYHSRRTVLRPPYHGQLSSYGFDILAQDAADVQSITYMDRQLAERPDGPGWAVYRFGTSSALARGQDARLLITSTHRMARSTSSAVTEWQCLTTTSLAKVTV